MEPLAVLNRTAIVADDHRLSLEVELPPDCPTGKVEVTLMIRLGNGTTPRTRFADLRGIYAGKVWMADDFDAPLDDFKDYM